MGRPALRVDIGLREFVKLAYFALAAHEHDSPIGDCNLATHFQEIFDDIQANSKFSVSLEQLDSLVFHYMEYWLGQHPPSNVLKFTAEEPQEMMRRLKRWIPEYVKENEKGYLEFKGFHHREEWYRRRKEKPEEFPTQAPASATATGGRKKINPWA